MSSSTYVLVIAGARPGVAHAAFISIGGLPVMNHVKKTGGTLDERGGTQVDRRASYKHRSILCSSDCAYG